MSSTVLGRALQTVTLACALTASCAGAHAAIIEYAYSGIVGYGYDRAGIFGQDESLTGKPFTLVERFDTARNVYRYVDTAQSLQFGGSTRGLSDTASLTVTIGGVGRSIDDLEDYIYSGAVTGKHLDFVKDQSGYEYGGFYVASPFMPADYATAFTLDPTQATFVGSYQYFNAGNTALATYASFNVQRLTAGPISPVPLPNSLALFGASLMIVGVMVRALRRRRRNAP